MVKLLNAFGPVDYFRWWHSWSPTSMRGATDVVRSPTTLCTLNKVSTFAEQQSTVACLPPLSNRRKRSFTRTRGYERLVVLQLEDEGELRSPERSSPLVDHYGRAAFLPRSCKSTGVFSNK